MDATAPSSRGIKRIATLDFEGSSLYGVPVEAGVAIWEPGASTIHVWSALILPTAEWQDDVHLWDPDARELHGLGQDVLLAQGRPVGDVAHRLNELLGGSTAYCDGGEIDAAYRTHLYEAARMRPLWRLGTMAQMARVACEDPTTGRRVLKRIFRRDGEVAHRAGADAARLLMELASETVERVTVIDLGH